jgi:hypothetical protein
MFPAFLPYITSSVNSDVRKVWCQVKTDQMNLKEVCRMYAKFHSVNEKVRVTCKVITIP